MTNLLEETLRIITGAGMKEEDIRWVGNSTHWSSWEDAKPLFDVDYDGGYGAAEVAQDLMVVGDDWWMTRGEYDGSEWWDFHRKPNLPDSLTRFRKVHGGMWPSLEGLNPHLGGDSDEDDD